MRRFLLLLTLPLISQLTDAQQILTPELLWKFARVSDARISPDGRFVLCSVRRIDYVANKGNTDIWRFDLSTGQSSAIASDSSNESSARWNADGSLIYFTNDAGGSSQVWTMNPDGTGKKQFTHLDSDVNGFGVAAAGNRMWLALDVKVKEFNGKEIYKDLPKTTGRIYDDLMFRHWDRWDDGVYSHIHVAEIANGAVGTPKDIMAGEPFDSPLKPNGGEEEISWSPDGKTLAYTCKKSVGAEYATTTNSDIYLYDAVSGSTTDLTSGMMGYDKSPSFSPDGGRIVWISQEEPGNEADRMRLFLFDFKSAAKRELSIGYDQNIENVAWSSSGDRLYFLGPLEGTQQVFVYDFKSKSSAAIRQLTKDVAEHVEVTVGYDAKRKEDVVVTSRMSMSAPNELFLIDLKTGVNQPVSAFNSELLSTIRLGKVEKRMVRATDGKQILTWVITPPDMAAGKKYPALLYCQGGPQSMVGQYWSYRWNFQLMAANGYVVVAPNRRGLPGFGSEWNDAISGDWGGQAMKDLLSAIDSVSNESYVDKSKMGAVGASFGGYSVYWLAGNHNGRFKAFISHNGVYNMRSMLATEELFFYQHENQGYPWEKKESKAFGEFSPDSHVDRWDTPILVIANERDYRVPYTQGLEAYTAARLRGVPARLLSFPDENHWVLKPQNGLLWQRVFYGWLDKYLK